jgi:hypothetical protein
MRHVFHWLYLQMWSQVQPDVIRYNALWNGWDWALQNAAMSHYERPWYDASYIAHVGWDVYRTNEDMPF